MNELHKYTTFSIDLLGKSNKVNSMFSIGRARIFYIGTNRNYSYIDENVAAKLASTIPGTPIIGTYNDETQDFEGHEGDAKAYGFVPLDPNSQWVEENGHKYLEVDVVIWDGRFGEAQSILKDGKSLSMELNPLNITGKLKEIDGVTYYQITFAEFAGITILGKDVEPCFEDARFFSAYSSMVNAYSLYIESMQKNDKGGKNVMEDEEKIVEPVAATEVTEVVEDQSNIVAEEAIVEDTEPKNAEEQEAEANEQVNTETVETEETDFNKEESEDAKNEIVDNACKDKNSLEEELDDDAEKNKSKDEEYSKIATELSDCQSKYSELEIKYNNVLKSLNEYSKKEKLEIISKFSTKIESDELINKLTQDVDNYSIDQIKTELGKAIVDQMSIAESTEEEKTENFSLNLNIPDNTIDNSAWDIVKRFKQNN